MRRTWVVALCVAVVAGAAVLAIVLSSGPTYPDEESAAERVVREHETYCDTKVERISCTDRGDTWRCTYATADGSGSSTFPKDDGGHPEVQIIC